MSPEDLTGFIYKSHAAALQLMQVSTRERDSLLIEIANSVKKHKNAKRKLADIEKDDDFDNFKFNIELPPIKLYITSEGGLVYQVFSLIDTIQNLRVPVHTICKGFVASAGTLLSLAGKKRFITENSYMLIQVYYS